MVDELAKLAESLHTEQGTLQTAIDTLFLHRWQGQSEPAHGLQQPALCVVARGRKVVTLADQTYTYDPNHYLLVSVDLPTVGKVIEGPYLGVRLDLPPSLINEVMLRTQSDPEIKVADQPGLGVSPLTPALLGALVRLLLLIETPNDIPVLAPLIQHEIVYHLLNGPQGDRLRRMARPDSTGVIGAIRWLKDNYAEPLRIEHIARQFNMSSSGLHHQFKAVTAMSPLQYQKQLRLQEARRLLLSEVADAASVSYQVGYNSPSQFSREYSRLFGHPPQRDIARLRGFSMSLA